MLYFDIVPKELLYEIIVKLRNELSIYMLIKIFNLDYDITFRLLSIDVLSFLSKYKVYEEFHGRIISWPSIYDNITEYISPSEIPKSLLSLATHRYFHHMKDLYVLLLKEYSEKITLGVGSSDELAKYEYGIYYSIYHPIAGSTMYSFMDIITLAGNNIKAKRKLAESCDGDGFIF